MASLIIRHKFPFNISSFTAFYLPARNCSSITSMANSTPEPRKEDIVIVGGGISGLATAVSLQRQGIKSLVLEQAESLRTGGTSLTLSKNGWKALDTFGLGDELRPKFLNIKGIDMKTGDGRELQSLTFDEGDTSREIRPVERRTLLEAMVNRLPSDAIRFSSKLKRIEKVDNDQTLLKLEDDSQISAKIVIACDGIWSPVARWMGFRDPKYVGYCAMRGMGVYPAGHSFEQRVKYLYGKGLRAGYVPVSSTKVYWFITFNTSSPGTRNSDPSSLRQETMELLQGYPSELLKVVDSTPDDTLIRSPLMDRWLWPVISPPPFSGKVVLVGDAWHPMTPNMGQGACCALEDAVVLTDKLSQAIKHGTMSVEDAFRSYESERWSWVFPMTIRSNLVGALSQTNSSLVRYIRDKVFAASLNKLGPRMKST